MAEPNVYRIKAGKPLDVSTPAGRVDALADIVADVAPGYSTPDAAMTHALDVVLSGFLQDLGQQVAWWADEDEAKVFGARIADMLTSGARVSLVRLVLAGFMAETCLDMRQGLPAHHVLTSAYHKARGE